MARLSTIDTKKQTGAWGMKSATKYNSEDVIILQNPPPTSVTHLRHIARLVNVIQFLSIIIYFMQFSPHWHSWIMFQYFWLQTSDPILGSVGPSFLRYQWATLNTLLRGKRDIQNHAFQGSIKQLDVRGETVYNYFISPIKMQVLTK